MTDSCRVNSGGFAYSSFISVNLNASEQMPSSLPIKIVSIAQFFDLLPENERIIVDLLRQIVRETLPADVKEKFAYNVPFYYGKKRICLIWPATIPRGGIRQGVLFGFCQGYRLNDEDHYLEHGTNKQVFYKIYTAPEQIDEPAIKKLVREALRVDGLPAKKI
jgi:hypothetical protein